MSADRDDGLRAALALLRTDPPDNGFEQRLSARLAYEVSLRPLRDEPPARDFEQRLHERLMAEPDGPALRLVGAEAVAVSASSDRAGLTPGTPGQVGVAPLPSATSGSLAAAAPSPVATRKRKRGAWLAAAIVLLAGGATASAQSGLLVGLRARVEHVVSAWSRSSATAERERAATVTPRPERIAPRPSELAPRPAPEVAEVAGPEPVVEPPPAPAAAPVERLELSAEQRARANEASAQRSPIERLRGDVTRATRERQSREGRAALPRASRLSAGRRDDGPRRSPIERVRIEPGTTPARQPFLERVRPGEAAREATRERQSRERPELIMIREGPRPVKPDLPRRERPPQDLTRGERPRR